MKQWAKHILRDYIEEDIEHVKEWMHENGYTETDIDILLSELNR